MLKLIQTIKNIWKIEDLRVRLLFTAGFIMIYRLGSYIVLPGIDPNALAEYSKQANEGLLGLINMFAGGAFSRASIFALGIMPYISASIVIQLLGIAVPYFQKLQKEGESGRKKINQITRVLTIAVTAVQSVAFLRNLNVQAGMAIVSQTNPDALSPTIFFITSITLLTTGTMFVMWLGEKITDKGIGNGISILIMIGIIARLPQSLFAEFDTRLGEAGGGLIIFFLEIVALLFVILGTVLLVQGTRRIPVQYAKRIVGNRQYGGVRQYLPLKVNSAGVMPIIFAQALMFIPPTVAQFFPNSASWSGIAGSFNNYASFGYNFTFAILIILFTYFYTAVTINPVQIADDLKRNGGFIPGIKPGKKTANYIDSIMSRITFPGSIFLALVAIMPAFAMIMNVNSQFAQFFGGTSLLIMVGVILDTLQQIESHLLMRHYDGLMKSGRIKGRTGGSSSGL
ncbi:MAG: preprotein translocase subunit SecY [Bacteroidetes bacterium]|jgi:preprotein translocase subunit SecY|nr:preprotein translocase subunit SecY [Bacteroidota bacterium]MBT5527900.1 preprotein translocase subunit SecY [Cytophagia bacterium]MBT3424917.1 preprotein translocase subunit SecY [Bacteroidota bacterium]MBT3933955.1 preprotein translocase subunit SecY [Bacteroidota bacterium]MBT4338238.1 preprotein translocase subunit SecY [Bacteroidota bacterium]